VADNGEQPFPRIEEMWAWLSTDPSDGEGVIGYRTGDGWWMPLMGADRERIESYRWHADLCRRATGRPVILARYSQRTDVEVIE